MGHDAARRCLSDGHSGSTVKPPVERTRRGYRINLDVEERELIHRLMGEFRSLLLEPSIGDDRMRRLFPTAYHQPGDRELDAEFQRLMHEELLTSRLKGLDAIDGILTPQPDSGRPGPLLTEAQMSAFMQALNGLRLVLGTMIDVGEDHDLDSMADDHPLIGEFHLYDFLSWVLDASVRAMQS